MEWQPRRWWAGRVAERVCKGTIDIVVARVGNHVFFRVGARLRQQRGKRVRGGVREIWDTAGDLARFSLPLSVGTTQEAALLAFLTGAFFVRWV